ncbi:MAG: YitT family protein, partial [Alicyclobacillus sp.]|nr:YitT family protein [Alicyclobacillus sp.]
MAPWMRLGKFRPALDNRMVNLAIRIAVILIGNLFGAVSVNNFLVPAHILAGGLTGVSQLLYHWWELPIGFTYFMLNIPLLALGWRYLGKRFVLLTAVGIMGFSVLTDEVHLRLLSVHDPLLLGLYGGVLGGLSSGMVIRAGGSTGGTDVVGLVFHRLMNKSVGGVGFAVNVVIVALSMT